MKKTSVIAQLIIVCTILVSALSCSKSVVQPTRNSSDTRELSASSSSNAEAAHKQAIGIHTVTTGGEGNIALGNVDVTGAINATGTYVMDIAFLGKSIHCSLILTLPDGTITIRMNCNVVTLDGQWQILEGTGAYTTLKGNGSLIMPDDFQEILTGDVKWQ